jgi:hypothetical protein
MRDKAGKIEAGVILIVFVMTIPCLLGLMALAIDSGNLYLAKLRLTKVARISSATALNMMALRGWGAMVADPLSSPDDLNLGLKTANLDYSNPDDTLANQAVLKEMRNAAIEALKKYYPASDFAVNNPDDPMALPEYLQYVRYSDDGATAMNSLPLSALDLLDSSIKASFRYSAKTYLLGAISQILGGTGPCSKSESDSSARCWVESSSPPDRKTGKMRPANVFMLLDVSGSMNEMVSENSTKTKKTALDEAAATFIDMFNPLSDKFSIIPYATTADNGDDPVMPAVLITPSPPGIPDYLEDKYKIRNQDRFKVGGQTNPCDALLQVARAIQADTSTKDPLYDHKTPKFVLLFTDGAPNVYRLEFCKDGDCQRNPTLIDAALTKGGANTSDDRGWYGWTVKWDKRSVFRMGPASGVQDDFCGSNEFDIDPDRPSISRCDPVWAFPRVIKNDQQELTYSEVSSNLRLNEDGEFYFIDGEYAGNTISQLGFSLKFEDQSTTTLRDYQRSDAYRWNGPSYLTHASFIIPRGLSLTDRLPRILDVPNGRAPITCGPGSRSTPQEYPGSLITKAPRVADKYNHSLYFASRAIDANWRTEGNVTDESGGKASKVALSQDHLKNAPAYFEKPHVLRPHPDDSPGCLTDLTAKIPFSSSANIYLGANFVSNPEETIHTRGEALKTAELPYHCALRAADWLRSEYNVVIFVVGLGPSATSIYDQSEDTPCEDPLQNALDPNSRKDRFLRRLALAPESLSDPEQFLKDSSNEDVSWSPTSDFRFRRNVSLSNCVNHPLAGLAVELGYSEAYSESMFSNVATGPFGYSPSDHKFTKYHLGGYYGAEDPAQLKMIFGEIAKRILLRLSS